MKNRHYKITTPVAVALALILGSNSANSAEVYLEAGQFDKTIDGATITMWGYQTCDSDFATNCTGFSSPGPQIDVPAGDSDLTVHLKNSLGDSTSIMVAGQRNAPLPISPTRDLDGRLKSFVPEVDPGAVGIYTWTVATNNPLTPGAFLYQSGSFPAKQVQMGLYGAVVHDSECSQAAIDAGETTCAYPDVAYDATQVLVFSEIDPALHSSQSAANASKTGYVPRYFLINGEDAASGNLDPLLTANVNDRILLRMINAGLENHAPQLLGGNFDVIAEDGRLSPTRHSQNTILLTAAKSHDLMFQPDTYGTYPLFDRRLRTVTDTAMNGGMFAKIKVNCGDCVDFSAGTQSYAGGQDVSQTAVVLDSGAGVRLEGNTWRKTLGTYDIGPYTMLEFTFESGGTVPAEIQGIGFDADNTLSPTQVFQLTGTQNWGDRTYSYSGTGPQTYTIPVGEFYTGTGMYLVLANDHDVAPADSTGSFTNVRIYNTPPPPTAPVITSPGNQTAWVGSAVQFAVSATDINLDVLTFSADVMPDGLTMAADGSVTGTPTTVGVTTVTVTVDDGTGLTASVAFDLTVLAACADCIDFAAAGTSSFSTGQDIDGNVAVLNTLGIRLAGNTWRQTDTTYNITPNTVLEFTFEAGGTLQAEIQGIGFDADAALSPTQIFQLTGTQAWGNTAGGTYTGGVQTFTIPVGTFYQGTGMHLVLANDHDVANPDSSGTFTGVRIYETTPTP